MSEILQSRYVPPSTAVWQGRSDTLPGERIFQLITCCDLRQPLPLAQNEMSFAFLGFCCDEGIKRNGGRLGAAQGPQALRQAMGRLAVHFNEKIDLIDAGDIVCTDENLETSQLALKEAIELLINNGFKPIVLGGGHETSYGHYLGLRSSKSQDNIGIINFDAHFDMRIPKSLTVGNSGTPFYQIAQLCKMANTEFNYYCIGIQRAGNTHSLFQTAEQFAVNYIFADAVHQQPIANFFHDIDDFIQGQTHIYLSFCLDVLAQSVAPGVSASQALGLLPQQVIPLIKKIVASKKVISFDIVELSPPYDRDGMTAQLGAMLIWEYLHAFC